MHMKRIFTPDTKNQPESLVQDLCTEAHREGRKDMAVALSFRLELLAMEAASKELSAVEIVQLLRDESERWGRQWQ